MVENVIDLTAAHATLETLMPNFENHGPLVQSDDDRQSNISGQPRMAPNLAASKQELIHDMIVSGELFMSRLAEAAGCSKRIIPRMSSNIQYGYLVA
jgi:hypothetical protein